MFIEYFLAAFFSQLTVMGILVCIHLLNKKRDYDREYLHASAASTLLEIYLRNRFPKSVSDKIVPVPDGQTIPAPLYFDQNTIPLTAHEIGMRMEAVKMFIVETYGNIRTFHKDVIDTFVCEESDQSDMPDFYAEEISENQDQPDKKEAPVETKKKKEAPENPKDAPENPKEAPENPKEEKSKEIHQENQKKEKTKERDIKTKPKSKKEDDLEPIIVERQSTSKIDSDSDSENIIELKPPSNKNDSESDSSTKGKHHKVNDVDIDDDFIANLISQNGVKKSKSKKDKK